MSHPLATYSFLPWLRQGLANRITAPDNPSNLTARAAVKVELTLAGERVGEGEPLKETVARDVALFGPGDIVGLDRRSIFRVEPRNWITNFEPNYLAHVEFYDEDIPWRYTPAAPAGHRLRPWIALVVLAEGEFVDGKNIQHRPLPFIEVGNPNIFPPAAQLWAWAHVHVNRSLAANDDEFQTNDMAAVLPRLQAVLDENPDLAYSRLVCPRKLAENTAYHAFIVPVFETGRLAGLGLDPDDSPGAVHSAWADYPPGSTPATKAEPQSFPYYFRWFFRTGQTGDFESLVRLLKPKPVDKRVGTRDMDVQEPGANLPGVEDPAPGGVLKLGGALRVPRINYTDEELVEVDKFENWATPYPRPFQESLAALINLTDDYDAATVANANQAFGTTVNDDDVKNDPDPLITPPLYGTWHALTRRLLRERDGSAVAPNTNKNWVHELNLDPRHRVAAGFGTRVVQKEQEKFMEAAWRQIGDVLEANRRIRFAQVAREVSWMWYSRHLLPLHEANREKAFLMTAPVHKRVLAGGFTTHHQLSASLLQPTLTSTAMRRVLRPRGRLMSAAPFGGGVQPGNLLARVNEGEVSAAPPKVTPPGLTTINELADAVLPKDVPPVVVDLLRRRPWIRVLLVVLSLVFVLLAVVLFLIGARLLAVLAVVVAVILFLLFLWLSKWHKAMSGADTIREENQTPEAVDSLPNSPDFTVTEPDSGFTPTFGTTDSAEGILFKDALKDAFTLIEASTEAGAEPPKVAVNLPGLSLGVIEAINPTLTIPKRTFHGIFLPPRVQTEMVEEFVEAMAYPVFDTPMYKPLTDPSAELFLPNINLVEKDSITLLETNQKFIEAYMVGLNHEFARELLWREYPTDQRGSYFRQFWDVSGFFNTENLDDEGLKEKLRDIPKLHLWSKFSKLGDHDHRELPGESEDEIVLVIRGELLKRYPTAVIYAHRAKWQLKAGGGIDNKKERELVELVGAEEDKPPRAKVRTPLYEAKVEPDIYFFGFDLTAEKAKGGTGENPSDDPGWFFVIKERPGEPRFGLDIDKQPDLNVWNDLSWKDVQPADPGAYIQLPTTPPQFNLVATSSDEDEKKEQHLEDVKIFWKADMSSADLAYVLFQAPVLVGVHAAEMLPKK